MDQVLVGIGLALLREIPALIANSKTMDEAAKKRALEQLAAELEVVKARVAAVTFRDL